MSRGLSSAQLSDLVARATEDKRFDLSASSDEFADYHLDEAQARAWAVVSDVERWPQRTASITSVKLLNSPPFGLSSEARIHQPKLPAATGFPDREAPWSRQRFHIPPS